MLKIMEHCMFLVEISVSGIMLKHFQMVMLIIFAFNSRF